MDWLKEFFDACSQGNLDLVKNSMARGIDPHSKNDFALVVAANSGNIELIRFFVEDHSFDVNAWDGSALHHAAASGRLETVQFLLKRGAQIDSQEGRALRWAILRGQTDVVRFLVASGATRGVISPESLTIACGNGYLDLVEYLIEKIGLDPHANHEAPLRSAVIEGHCAIVSYLVRKAKADILVDDSFSLRQAAKVGNFRMVKEVITLGADVHAKKGEALRSSVKCGHLACVIFLVEQAGADFKVLSKEDIAGLSDKAVKAYLADLLDSKAKR